MPRQLRVFLCHASQDKPAVRELYKRLKAEDWIDPWLDEEKLSFGQHWTTAIEDALSEADVVIIFLSKNSVQKEGFVQRELNYAWELSLEKPRNVIFLIPFRLDDCQIPRYLGSRQWGDYFGDKKENTYQILLRSLKQRYQQKLKLEAEEERVERETAKIKKQEEAGKKAELEFIEKAKLKEAKKKTEWEATERIARERAESKKIELVQAKQAEKKERLEKEKLKPVLPLAHVIEKKTKNDATPAPKLNIRILGIGGIIFALLLLAVLVGNSLFKNINSAPTEPVINFVPSIGSTKDGEDGMILVYVPEGEFTIGSDASSDEQPIHQVNLDAYWIDRTEVTNAMYAKCVSDGRCTPPSSKGSYTHNNYYGNSEFDDFPVIYVNWNQANEYCSRVGRRLPTEAEWEKAARGTDGRMYPWGNTFDGKIVNFCDVNCSFDWANKSFDDGYEDVALVGNYPTGKSIYGVLDMAGNVWEWVSTFYDDYPYNESDGRENLIARGYPKVLRGGSWSIGVSNISSANRNKLDPSSTSYFLGFRCAMDATP